MFEKLEFLVGTLILSNFENRSLEQKQTQDKISFGQRGNISGGGKWANLNTNNTYKHLLIDIAEYAGQTITCTRTGTYKYYAFLTSDNRVNNVVPSFVSDTSRVSGDANAVTIPATATLFYTSIADEDGEINLPTLKIGSVEIDYNKSIE